MAAAVHVLVVAVAACSISVQAQSRGDVRLYLNGSTNVNLTQGVVEVYLDDQWGTVCSEAFNKGSAAAVCRQQGFIDILDYGTPQQFNFQSPPGLSTLLTNVSCNSDAGNNNDFSAGGSLHILRCPHGYISSTAECTTNDVVAVKCVSTRLSDNPYRGQVRLVDGSLSSSGLLEIYLRNEWGTVCDTGFTMAAADSVCRQLQYTSALEFNISNSIRDSSAPVWIDETHCDASEKCFSISCIDYPSSSGVTSGQCSTHELDVTVTCTYEDDTLPPGNEYECSISLNNTLAIILGSVFGSVALLCLIILIVVFGCCCTISTCPLYAYRNKRKYDHLI